MRIGSAGILGVLMALGSTTPPAFGQDQAPLQPIKIEVVASPASEVAVVGLESGGAGIIKDTSPFRDGEGREFLVPPDNGLFRSTLYAEWRDGAKQSIPFFRLSNFGGLRPLNINVIKHSIGAQSADQNYLNSNCDGAPPDNTKDAFQAIAACAPAARFLKQQDPRSREFFKALNAWFVANYYLYSKLGYGFHPFGLQDELVENLKYIVELQQQIQVRNSAFRPLRIPDIKLALREYEAEPVRMVKLLNTLRDQREYKDALAIARAAKTKHYELSNGNPNEVIFEVTGPIIDGWIRELESLVLSQTPGN
jgi:hypothetical protein